MQDTWQELEEGIIALLSASMSAILTILIIGMLVGTWLASGIVPAMIYYGIQILNPSIFLVITVILCAIVSIAIGSSWTTAATIGIGQGMGIPVPVIGGAIISGAYFGDKMSPLSDTTNLAPAIAGSKLFDHIRYMVEQLFHHL